MGCCLSDLNLDNLRQFRATWPNENESARVKLGNFRAFIGFCHKAKWIEENYAKDLKAAKVVDQKIVPLEPDEIDKILKACDKHPQKNRGALLKAMILVMLYTALRIRDVVTLRRDSVRGSRLFLRTAKTSVDVFCPLPPRVVAALGAIPAEKQKTLVFLERRLQTQERGRRLPEVPGQGVQGCRRYARLPAPVPTYMRHQSSAGRCALAGGLNAPRTLVR